MSQYDSVYKYVIVGGGIAGASAIEGIREIDNSGRILLICGEPHLPYHRPPLSKGLWLGKKKVEDIFAHDGGFYESNGVTIVSANPAETISVRDKTVHCVNGTAFSYGSLLVATGGSPRTFSGGQAGIGYYRYLDDYVSLRRELMPGKAVAIVGGGFIGSEMAAVLSATGIFVTMIFPEKSLCPAVFPASLAGAVRARFEKAGVRILAEDKPKVFNMSGSQPVIETVKGESIKADCIIAGLGINPATQIAEKAGLDCDNGIVVNERLQTSQPDVYAAGDVARFPYPVLATRVRVEHWDNALSQGRLAGRNMAGAGESYTHMPYFFSDLFEYGYEAVGDVDASYETVEDWQKENEKGVIYYLKDSRCVGVLLLNVWDKCDAAREIIRGRSSASVVRGAIR